MKIVLKSSWKWIYEFSSQIIIFPSYFNYFVKPWLPKRKVFSKANEVSKTIILLVIWPEWGNQCCIDLKSWKNALKVRYLSILDFLYFSCAVICCFLYDTWVEADTGSVIVCRFWCWLFSWKWMLKKEIFSRKKYLVSLYHSLACLLRNWTENWYGEERYWITTLLSCSLVNWKKLWSYNIQILSILF